MVLRPHLQRPSQGRPDGKAAGSSPSVALLAGTRGIAVIEDAAQAHGSEWREVREVEGIESLTTPPQVTRHARYLYVFKRRAEAFGGLPKPRFTERASAKNACDHKGLL